MLSRSWRGPDFRFGGLCSFWQERHLSAPVGRQEHSVEFKPRVLPGTILLIWERLLEIVLWILCYISATSNPLMMGSSIRPLTFKVYPWQVYCFCTIFSSYGSSCNKMIHRPVSSQKQTGYCNVTLTQPFLSFVPSENLNLNTLCFSIKKLQLIKNIWLSKPTQSLSLKREFLVSVKLIDLINIFL